MMRVRSSAGWQNDEESLKALAEHVNYEIRCFHEALRGMDNLADSALNNLVSEALLLHARNLLEFFYPNRVRQDGVYASTFTVWTPKYGPNDAIAGGRNIRELQKRLHRRLAHVSRWRTTEKSAPGTWSIAELAVSLALELKHFIGCLPGHRRHWFENASLMSRGYRHWPGIDTWLAKRRRAHGQSAKRTAPPPPIEDETATPGALGRSLADSPSSRPRGPNKRVGT